MPRSPAAQILVVDDDGGLLRLIDKSLRRQGFAVTTAASGAEALGALAEGRFSLALIDLKLPDIGGPDLIAEISRRQPGLPFAVITGQGDERVAVEMMRQGAVDYLVKDADFLETMPPRVRRAIEHLQQRERLAQAEEALRREHAFITAVLDTSGGLVIVLDRSGQVVRFNRAAETLTGFTAADLTGKPFLEHCVPPEERAEVAAMFQRLFSGEKHLEHLNHILTRNGSPRLIAWSNSILEGDSGELRFLIKTGIDITERRRLEREILEISGREQRRIGQDLHDGLGQHLTGIELMSQSLEQALAKKKRPEAAHAAKIASYVREAIVQAKNLARGLSPVELERHGLMSALQELCRATAATCAVECEFVSSAPVLIDNHAHAIHLYRIAQEAVNNAVRHGKARRITLALNETPGGAGRLHISDDGTGFPASQNSSGMGLRIMNYRAAMIGGTIELSNRPEGGAQVSCTFQRTL